VKWPFAPHAHSHVLDTVLGPEVDRCALPAQEAQEAVETALKGSEITLAVLEFLRGDSK